MRGAFARAMGAEGAQGVLAGGRIREHGPRTGSRWERY